MQSQEWRLAVHTPARARGTDERSEANEEQNWWRSRLEEEEEKECE